MRAAVASGMDIKATIKPSDLDISKIRHLWGAFDHNEFAADTTGDASYLLTWAGGDSLTGLRIVDGKAYEHDLVSVLGERTGEVN